MSKENVKRIKPSNKFNTISKNLGSLTSVYQGFVQSNEDEQMMGKLQVWIPSINSDKNQGTFSVSYVSPFAGASPIQEGAQTSYGFWAIPGPGDEVIVMFIDGDPNKGIWIGCLYQQYMNHMIPGIASSKLEDGTSTGPSMEYNKAGKFAANSPDPLRPEYTSLSTGLKNQGLTGDYIRGQTTASARKSSESKVVGMLSPGGNQFVLNDDEDDQFIRLRTKSGAQLLVNETVGMIYAITKNGNSWAEISDDGIDLYTSKTMSFRSQQDMNFHSDGDINFFSTNAINMTSMFNTNVSVGTGLNIIAGSTIKQQSGGKISISSGADFALSSNGNFGLDSGSDLALRGCGTIGITSCDSIMMKSGKIMQNSGEGPTPISPDQPAFKDLSSKIDRQLDASNGYPEISTKTIVSRLPTHEPFAGHPTSSTKPSNSGVNLNVSQRVNLTDTSISDSQPSSSDVKTGTENNTTNQPDSTDSDWWIPVSGIVSSLYHDRSDPIHKNGHDGVDIAAPKNSIIMSSRAGKVIWSGSGARGSGYYGYGNCVAIDHGDGYISMYGHMNSTACSVNDKVYQGQTIGFVGNTGHSSGNHCHFEIRLKGNRINPASILPILGNKGARVTSGKQRL